MAEYLALYSDIYNFQTCPPKWVREINTKIYLDSDYYETGCVNGFLINYRQMNSDKANLYKVFAAIDEHAATAYQIFFQPGIHLVDNIEAIYYIKEFFINEDKRSRGIGSKALELLPGYLDDLTRTTVTHLFLYPFPLSQNRYGNLVPDRNRTEKIPTLRRFYAKNGFEEMNVGGFGEWVCLKTLCMEKNTI